VIHTSSLTDELIARAMQAGARQVVAKSLAGNALLYAIRAATGVTEAS
jgi:DNA-binding NarL/FixJ family response regulator